MPIEISSRDGILQYPSGEASQLLQGLEDDGNPSGSSRSQRRR